MGQEPDPEKSASRATRGWTRPAVTRVYSNDEKGSYRAEREAEVLAAHGYVPEPAVAAIADLFVDRRTRGPIQVTFAKRSD
jgi:hypothetical protein